MTMNEQNTANNTSAQSTGSMIEQAQQAAERLEKANKERAELLRREEEMEARRRLGGQTDAGQAPVVKKELTPREYAQMAMRNQVPK